MIGNSKNSLGKEVKERIKDLKLGKKIKILQGKSNIDSFYKKIDFAISVSEEEGSSNFLLNPSLTAYQYLPLMLEEIKSFLTITVN